MSTPFVIHIDVGIEATEHDEWMHLYAYPDSGWDKANMEGMFQFHDIHRVVRPTPTQVALWKQGRDHADANAQRHLPIVVVSFVNHRRQEVNCLWFIEDDALSRARGGKGMMETNPHTGEIFEVPLNVENIFVYAHTFSTTLTPSFNASGCVNDL